MMKNRSKLENALNKWCNWLVGTNYNELNNWNTKRFSYTPKN